MEGHGREKAPYFQRSSVIISRQIPGAALFIRRGIKNFPDYALASAGLGMLWNKTRTTDLQ
ncbi:MAG: hypothetical protein WA579_17675, partial [Rhodomicrobium sp.]